MKIQEESRMALKEEMLRQDAKKGPVLVENDTSVLVVEEGEENV